MAEKKSGVNLWSGSGKLSSIQQYKTTKGESWNRLTMVMPAVDEFSHPVKVCFHTQSLKGRAVGQMIDVVASASTYITSTVDGNGVPQEFDNTRLFEVN